VLTIDRRRFISLCGLSGLSISSIGLGSRTGLAQTFLKAVGEMKPGEYTWHPDRAPDGPLVIIVSIPDQRVYVYRNGIRIAVSTCSTGKPGHTTPTGVFTILEKDRNHRSSTYNNAPMPNMNRLTWSGVALHAGNLPGYPASHGCVRLPMQFSELLFGITQIGTPVIIAGIYTDPSEVVSPSLVLSDAAVRKAQAAGSKPKTEKLPWQAETVSYQAPTSILISGADRTTTILENGRVIGQGAVTIQDPGKPLGSHVFLLKVVDESSERFVWKAVGYSTATGSPGHGNRMLSQPDESVMQRLRFEKRLLTVIRPKMRPGMTLITTDLPAHRDTRSGQDFVLMTQSVRPGDFPKT
jgi:L,D-transpeptidase catalytic domain